LASSGLLSSLGGSSGVVDSGLLKPLDEVLRGVELLLG
jgi:hypothetical protein